MRSRSGLLMAVAVVLALVAMVAGQGFYSTRYGKRSQGDRSTYVSRYSRASPNDQGPPQIKIRSSRFIGGSRYGKRSGEGLLQDLPPMPEDMTSEAMGNSVLVGDSVICLLVEHPDLFRCLRKPSDLLEN